ncbi:hypothetical protein P700755_003591 [Psychroflexus torquis ATCC 700755]|uniref:Uncharacterized protein n=1 Tax=Psychroflexus torquis (strain ATCC 700755 / CIP 106069 / ACAM 623) TaxID=313595 RepID=K4IXJ7_PSYTT|nr:hypothetical protein [Psychroflexus torquis]AFU70190.1 hypothetical protein P700755_003591 [Psychroflexus torquis ATCC 700755]
MSYYLRLLFIIFSVTYGVAQEKNEVEKRVKEDEIPNQAKEWLEDAFEQQRRTKWYYQTDGGKQGYEAKLKQNKHLHSVEFDMEGKVENIEIKIKEDEIKEEAYQTIFDYFKSNYIRYSLKKIQIQYTGKADDLEDLIDEDEIENLVINYEIEYYGKTDKDNTLWEGLFDANGRLIEKRSINLKLTDNLDY